MRMRLVSLTPEPEQSNPPLVQVYKRSYDICMKLYEKELFSDDSYLYIYGVQDADLNAEQLAVIAGLCQWRDIVARAEDESTGYILPNKALIEIAKQMPLTTNKLRGLVRSKHPYIERNLGAVVNVIRHSVQNAANFKTVVEHLKELRAARLAKAAEDNSKMMEGSELLTSETSQMLKLPPGEDNITPSTLPDLASIEQGTTLGFVAHSKRSSENTSENVNSKGQIDASVAALSKQEMTVGEPSRETENNIGLSQPGGATIQVLKKPSRAFGALLGNSAKRKFQPDKREPEQIKLEQIKSSVNLPFHSFAAGCESKPSEICRREESVAEPANDNSQPAKEGGINHEDNEATFLEIDDGDENISLSSLSSSFEKCFETRSPSPELPDLSRGSGGFLQVNPCFGSTNEARSPSPELPDLSRGEGFLPVEPFENDAERKQVTSGKDACGKSGDDDDKAHQGKGHKKSGGGFIQVKPFDYEAARKQVKFGKDDHRASGEGNDEAQRGKGRRKSGSGLSLPLKVEEPNDLLPQGKRRQAFPASGNRSATFR